MKQTLFGNSAVHPGILPSCIHTETHMCTLKLLAFKWNSSGHWNKPTSSFFLVSEEQKENDGPGRRKRDILEIFALIFKVVEDIWGLCFILFSSSN